MLNENGTENMDDLAVKYYELINRGLSQDDAFTEAYSEDCNND
jgi:hypothetical protein